MIQAVGIFIIVWLQHWLQQSDLDSMEPILVNSFEQKEVKFILKRNFQEL